HQRFLDTAPFANQTIADALLDSAVAAHGCVPGGGFCAQLPAKATSYLIGSSGLLSQDGIFVNATSAVLECANGPQNPGFDVAYTVVTNLTINASLPDAKKTSSFVQAWLLDVNTTLHRVVVRSPDTQRDVTFTCP
ncbi:MAG TPA: hypothetical protein VI874_04830, partial [Candidatus Norongarragalinales archaeon]|nr:hypothetical protein [Candidatus Norongarragalinales archaeon]